MSKGNGVSFPLKNRLKSGLERRLKLIEAAWEREEQCSERSEKEKGCSESI